VVVLPEETAHRGLKNTMRNGTFVEISTNFVATSTKLTRHQPKITHPRPFFDVFQACRPMKTTTGSYQFHTYEVFPPEHRKAR